MKESCANCTFFVIREVERKDIGDCRRDAPKIIFAEKGPNGIVSWQSGWPVCQPHNWCGEHRLQMKGGDIQ